MQKDKNKGIQNLNVHKLQPQSNESIQCNLY
jgi:hypothetical protein